MAPNKTARVSVRSKGCVLAILLRFCTLFLVKKAKTTYALLTQCRCLQGLFAGHLMR